MSYQVCGECNTSYSGSSCHVCAMQGSIRDQTAALLSAQEVESRRQDDRAAVLATAMRTATENQRENLAQAWRIQAEAKVQRAYELYQAELYDETLQLITQALEQDPGNLQGCLVAALAYERKGNQDAALVFYRKQIALLRVEPYADSLQWPHLVLRGLPEVKDLRNEFSDAVCSLAVGGRWADEDVTNFVSNLVSARMAGTALVVIRMAVGRRPSIALYGYWLDVTLQGEDVIEALRRHLETDDYAMQNSFLNEYYHLMSGKSQFSSESLVNIRDSIRDSYNAWLPQRRQCVRLLAQQQARAQSGLPSAAIGCLTAFLGLSIIAGILTIFTSLFTASLISFFAALACGSLVYVKVRKAMIVQKEASLHTQFQADEARWGQVANG
jgi:hypothetical protein